LDTGQRLEVLAACNDVIDLFISHSQFAFVVLAMSIAPSIVHIEDHVAVVHEEILVPDLGVPTDASMNSNDTRKGSISFGLVKVPENLQAVTAFESHQLDFRVLLSPTVQHDEFTEDHQPYNQWTPL
jgi:hypothetical protein